MDSHRLTATPTDIPVTLLPIGLADVNLALLRLDQISGWASGNKYFKLKHYLSEALQRGISHILSKGGMFSNHLAELAEACRVFDLSLTCVVRAYGDDPRNPTLKRIRACGGECVFVSPLTFRDFGIAEAAALAPNALFIPEGGHGPLGWKGTREIVEVLLKSAPTHVVLPAGTFGTAFGILSAAPADWQVILVPAWKGCTRTYVEEALRQAGITPTCRWQLWPDGHAGGYGRYDEALRQFMSDFASSVDVFLDPVYTGKMMSALYARLSVGFFRPGSRIVAIHTGGFQGLAGYAYRFPLAWSDYAADAARRTAKK